MAESVQQVIAHYPANASAVFCMIREQLFSVAAESLLIGPLEETLKWGEPAYLTAISRSGTTIRLCWKSTLPDKIGMYVNCRSRLVDQYRALFADVFHYQGNRGLLLDITDPLPVNELAICINMALRYHLDKKGGN